jgi:uncharacterized membrane protein HdeD (DUF308 family)
MDTSKHCRTWYVIEGILLILLGIAAIALPVISTLSLVLIIGWILLIGGVFHLYRTLRHLNTGSFWIGLINALLGIVLGILLLVYPLHGVAFLTLILGIFFLFEGIVEIAFAVQVKSVSANWGWLLFSGIIAIILSFIIWSGWPQNSTWVISLLVGINLIFFGFSLTLFAASHRR